MNFSFRWIFIGWNGWQCGWQWCVGVQKSVAATLENAFIAIIAIFLSYQEISQVIQKFYFCKTTDWQIHCSWNKSLLDWRNWKDWNFSTTISNRSQNWILSTYENFTSVITGKYFTFFFEKISKNFKKF